MDAATKALASALIGQELDGYRLEDVLGGGAFGVVFEVTRLSTNARFAMKVRMPSGGDAQTAAEFEVEGLILKKLRKCSGVIDWIESGTAMLPFGLGGAQVELPFAYHVLTLASGKLEELIFDPVVRAALSWEDRLSHWRGAIKGVHQMHLQNVVHRDLKSSNCLVMLDGKESEIRIADFGRSKDFNVPPSLPPIAYAFGRGDAQFAPPEHLWCQGGHTDADFRNADLYGLGSLFSELATGHPMTGLALGSWHDAREEGVRDYLNGTRRDLAVLRPMFHRAIEHMAADLPPAIRQEAVQLIRQLCDPVPSERQPKRSGVRRQEPGNGLLWLLRRVDIMSLCLSVNTPGPKKRPSNTRGRRKTKKPTSRSATL